MVVPATRALLGGIDVDDGATDRQLAVLQAVVAHLWKRPHLDIGTLAPLDAASAAAQIPDPAARRRVIQLLVTLELCRHPDTLRQIEQVETYAAAFGVDGPALAIIRRWIDEGVERATEDYDRFYAEKLPELSEP